MGVLRSVLFDNLGLKFVAMLLALLVYLHVYTERPATMMLSFPLELTDVADSLTLTGPSPAAVHAELRGTGKALIRLRLTEPRIKISLANAERGLFTRRLSADDLPLIAADGLEVTRLAGPAMIELELDRRVTRRVPVAPRVEADLSQGVTFAGRPTADPATLLVRGPASVVARLDSLRLRVVRADARRDTTRVEAQPAEIAEWCTVEPQRVLVTVVLSRPAGGPR